MSINRRNEPSRCSLYSGVSFYEDRRRSLHSACSAQRDDHRVAGWRRRAVRDVVVFVWLPLLLLLVAVTLGNNDVIVTRRCERAALMRALICTHAGTTQHAR